MHRSALVNGKHFHDVYVQPLTEELGRVKVVEIGSQDVNGSLRQFYGEACEYVGVDFVRGKGVDVILSDPYALPFADESADVVLSSSCLEHSEMFWLVVLEALRILKPHGLLYLNVPSNADFHRYPVDCWRFYPDSGHALVTWARRNGMRSLLLESFTSEQDRDVWNDMIMVILKDELQAGRHSNRMHPTRPDLSNVWSAGQSELLCRKNAPEDKRRLNAIASVLAGGLPQPAASDAEKLALIQRIITGAVRAR